MSSLYKPLRENEPMSSLYKPDFYVVTKEINKSKLLTPAVEKYYTVNTTANRQKSPEYTMSGSMSKNPLEEMFTLKTEYTDGGEESRAISAGKI
jgi:hypothetical protein